MSPVSVNHRWDQRSYLVRVGDAISQLINVALLNGMPDESVSGRSYRNYKVLGIKRWAIMYYLAEALFYIRDRGDHCRLAFIEDLERSRIRGQVDPYMQPHREQR